jgi:aminoglycoside phosphotransferase
LALMVATTMLYGAPSLAADPAASDVSVEKDLTAVIALQGLPCGQVVSVSQQGENDYIASCQDGNRYRVFVNADGRVVVEKK